MLEQNNPEINVEELMARVRQEVARRKQSMQTSPVQKPGNVGNANPQSEFDLPNQHLMENQLNDATEGALRAERETRVEKPFLTKLLNPLVRIKRQKRVNRALASSVHAVVPILSELLHHTNRINEQISNETRAREELEKRVEEQTRAREELEKRVEEQTRTREELEKRVELKSKILFDLSTENAVRSYNCMNEKLGVESKPPVFIHSMWRTGSTYVFNKFRKSKNFWCYYEPLNEQLQSSDFVIFETDPNFYRHNLQSDYFTEFKYLYNELIKIQSNEIPLKSFLLKKTDSNDILKKYLNSLIHLSPARPSFHFCRSFLRTPFIKENFTGLNIHLYREPRSQYKSMFVAPCFIDNYKVILYYHYDHEYIKPLLPLLQYHRPHLENDDSDLRNLLIKTDRINLFTKEEAYTLFYYFWALSHKINQKYCELSISIDLLSSDDEYRKKVSDELYAEGLGEFDFNDCESPFYQFNDEDVCMFEGVESKVNALIKDLDV